MRLKPDDVKETAKSPGAALADPLAALFEGHILDVVADGRVDAELFPNFARLAGASTWFHDNTSNSNQTWDALPPDQQP